MGDFSERNLDALHALPAHAAVGDFQIVGRELQHRRRRKNRFSRHSSRGIVHRVARSHRLPAGERAEPSGEAAVSPSMTSIFSAGTPN